MSTSANFQVDLHGVVDLLSHHLYSSTRVYLRELLQNAVDAITARRAIDPQCPAEVRLETSPGGLVVRDTGIGLTREQVGDLLATIGRSSKRDEIGFARQEFLGQFGIGLLSAYMVADEVRVLTQPAEGTTTLWVGSADGRYTVAAGPDRGEIGTTVSIQARRGAEEWLQPVTVTELATLYGSMLPYPVTVDGVTVNEPAVMWDRTADARVRDVALVTYAQEQLGFSPFAVIDLDVPSAGLTGVAFVLPYAASPSERPTHRIYLKRMLLSDRIQGPVPDWAFFVRAHLNTDELRPTASREALFEDPALDAAREAVGAQIRGWLLRLSATDPALMAAFLRIHHLGIKALAVHDEELLGLVLRWLPFETTQGRLTLAEVKEQSGEIRFTSTTEEFRQIAPVAAAQGLVIVNGGYTYDTELLEAAGHRDPAQHATRFDPSELVTAFETLHPATEVAARPFLSLAQAAMDEVGCEVVLRAFNPAGLPAMYLLDSSAAFADEFNATKDRVDQLWAGLLAALDTKIEARPQLILNHRNPIVRRLLTVADADVGGLATRALYGQALLQGRHPVSPTDQAALSDAFQGLLDRVLRDRTDE